jgi:hypothetical protein
MSIDKFLEVKLKGDGWTDFTGNVRGSAKITIVRGKANEQTAFTPSRCNFVLNNADGNFSDVNQNGINFGKIGPYTECRILTHKLTDTFNRTVANGMGTGNSGQTYSITGTAANFDIVPGAFTLVTSTTSQAATSGRWGDVHIQAKMSASADTFMGLTKRMDSGDRISAYIDTAANQVNVTRISDGATYAGTDYFRYTGGTYNPSVDYWMILSITEQIKVKVWTGTAADEPATWLISSWCDASHSTTDDQEAARNLEQQQGSAGVFAQANAGSQTVTFKELYIREIRFAGEIPSWPPEWDNSGKDAFVRIEANGSTRRINSKNSPVSSPITRSVLGALYRSRTASYYPLEDTQPAVLFRNAIKGGPDLLQIRGMQPAGYSGFPGSDPIFTATQNSAGFRANVDNAAVNMLGNQHFNCLYFVPEAGLPATSNIVTLYQSRGTGTVDRWVVKYTNVNGGSLQVQGVDTDGTALYDTGADSFGSRGVNGRQFALKLSIVDNGTTGSSTVTLGVTFLNDDNDYENNGTSDVFAVRYGSPSGMQVLTDIGGAIGQIEIGNWASSATAITNPHILSISTPYERGVAAYQGERSVARFIRLCAEEGVWGQVSTDYQTSVPICSLMGQQPRSSFVSLLQECEATEHGFMYEPRDTVGFALRTSLSIWNRLPVITFDYTAKPFSGSLLPTNDDQIFKNALTVAQPSGQRSQVFEITQGRKSVANAGEARGDYTFNFYPSTTDANQAQWTLRALAWDEQRVPSVTLELHRAPYQNDATMFSAASLLDICRVFISQNNPIWMQQGDLRQLVMGYTETIWNLTREITFNCVPYGPYQKVAVLNSTNTLNGFRVGWTDATLNGAHNSSVLTLSVQKGIGIFETGADAQFFYYVQVDDEVMKVTGITGASSPQSFTVQRGQLGTVARSHLASAPVLPYDFPVIGLGNRLS